MPGMRVQSDPWYHLFTLVQLRIVSELGECESLKTFFVSFVFLFTGGLP